MKNILLFSILAMGTLYAGPNPNVSSNLPPLNPNCAPIVGTYTPINYIQSSTTYVQTEQILFDPSPAILLLPKSGNFLLTGGNYP